jgi:O-acetyl-ADP-ribose deacetylase (regulator of RNase III)
MPFNIIRNDITKMRVDAIVNAANPSLREGGGVCGAIFKAAGALKLKTACDQLAPIQTGEAVVTPGFDLPAKLIIHTAGPVYHDGNHQEEELLRASYLNSMKRAVENKCESIAFPLISSGIYGYPKAEALRVATEAIRDFLNCNQKDIDVTLVIFDKSAFAVSERLLGQVSSYIHENYSGDYDDPRRSKAALDVEHPLVVREMDLLSYESISKSKSHKGLDDLVGNLDEPFSTTLLRLIDAKGRTDVEVYKRANIDRKLFSKIRTDKAYLPSKRTAVALAVALELTLAETNDLLKRAGYALSPSRKFDVIIEYFITSGNYDIFEINQVLFHYDQPLLGG